MCMEINKKSSEYQHYQDILVQQTCDTPEQTTKFYVLMTRTLKLCVLSVNMYAGRSSQLMLTLL